MAGTGRAIALMAVLCSTMGAAWPASGASSLEWSVTTLRTETALGQKEVKAVFPFRNTGALAVTVESIQIKPNCDCTTAAVGKRTYAPGEGGELKVTFALGDRFGRQSTGITVRTDAAGEEPTVLELEIDIPEPIRFEPPVLSWPRRGKPTPRTVEVRVISGLTLVCDGVTSDSEVFKAELAPISPRHYRLTVTPASTANPAEAIVRIESLSAPMEPFSFFAYIK